MNGMPIKVWLVSLRLWCIISECHTRWYWDPRLISVALYNCSSRTAADISCVIVSRDSEKDEFAESLNTREKPSCGPTAKWVVSPLSCVDFTHDANCSLDIKSTSGSKMTISPDSLESSDSYSPESLVFPWVWMLIPLDRTLSSKSLIIDSIDFSFGLESRWTTMRPTSIREDANT